MLSASSLTSLALSFVGKAYLYSMSHLHYLMEYAWYLRYMTIYQSTVECVFSTSRDATETETWPFYEFVKVKLTIDRTWCRDSSKNFASFGGCMRDTESEGEVLWKHCWSISLSSSGAIINPNLLVDLWILINRKIGEVGRKTHQVEVTDGISYDLKRFLQISFSNYQRRCEADSRGKLNSVCQC